MVTRIQRQTSFEALKLQIRQDKAERIVAFRAKRNSALRMSSLQATSAQNSPEALAATPGLPSRTDASAASTGPIYLLAQGDSWFDYPLPVPKFDQSDVIAHLKSLPNSPPNILSLAHHGETTEDMLGVSKLDELIENLKAPENGGFDGILFSGGGNDLAGNQFRLWVQEASQVNSNPTQALYQPRVDAIMGVVKAGYDDLIQARDTFAPGIPIFAHGYDFAIPTGIGVCGVGPWLKPSLDDRNWSNLSQGQSIVKEILIQFMNLLTAYQANSTNNFILVPTQGALLSTDWANELHPTPDGFAKIAARFTASLQDAFPGRVG